MIQCNLCKIAEYEHSVSQIYKDILLNVLYLSNITLHVLHLSDLALSESHLFNITKVMCLV